MRTLKRGKFKSLSELHRIIEQQKKYHVLLSDILFDVMNELEKVDPGNQVRSESEEKLKIAVGE